MVGARMSTNKGQAGVVGTELPGTDLPDRALQLRHQW